VSPSETMNSRHFAINDAAPGAFSSVQRKNASAFEPFARLLSIANQNVRNSGVNLNGSPFFLSAPRARSTCSFVCLERCGSGS